RESERFGAAVVPSSVAKKTESVGDLLLDLGTKSIFDRIGASEGDVRTLWTRMLDRLAIGAHVGAIAIAQKADGAGAIAKAPSLLQLEGLPQGLGDLGVQVAAVRHLWH